MSFKPPSPGQPGYQEWRDLADAVDAAGVLGAGVARDVTPWLSGHWKPVRVGCYERNYGPWMHCKEPVPLRDWWDGEQWRYLGDLGIGGVCVRQNQDWRGLASAPSAAPSSPNDQKGGV